MSLTSEDQLVEMKHQDTILSRRGGSYLLKVSRFVDQMLAGLYGLEAFYKAADPKDLVGQLVITLSPHTSCGVLNRIIGFADVNVGFAHPYTISARRRNCDGDEDSHNAAPRRADKLLKGIPPDNCRRHDGCAA